MIDETIYFRSITLKNVRCFGSPQTVYFTDNNAADGQVAMWNVILGENGVGKTTVLRALSCILYDNLNNPVLRNFYDTLDRQKNVLSPHIEASYSGYDFSELTKIAENVVDFSGNKFTSDFVFAYGATRKISTMLDSDGSPNRFKSLFDEAATLGNPEEWLIKADYLALKNNDQKRFKIISDAIRKLMIEEVESFEIRTENNNAAVYFKTHYGEVRLHQLSLGYKTLLAWITDLAKGLVEKYPESNAPLAEPAICLVDEIDLHMHPKMQRSVVRFLRETFPQTQFIVTAHSPLIVQSEEDTNVILLRRNGDEVQVVNDVDYVTSWRIDQILSSDLFGTGAYSPQTEQKLKQRRNIILKDKPTKTQRQQLASLDDAFVTLPVSESPEAIKAREIIKQYASTIQ
jgi:predicted ATP-binding protein involved in virulence